MKKILILLLALIAVTSANAQFRWGATAGADLTTLKFKQDLFTVDHNVGGQAGVQGEMIFPGIGFGIDVGMMYSMRGARLNLGEKLIWSSQGYTDPRCILHDIDIPINLRFKWTRMQGLEDYVAPYVFGGPVFTFLAGHSSVDALDYARMDLGLQAGLGFELYHNWQVQASYNWGMTYAVKTQMLQDLSARSRTWSFRVVYYW